MAHLSTCSSAYSEFDWSSVDTSNLPESYKTNSPKEQMLLQVADNFHRQYAHLCPDREPLFLHPINECRVEVSGRAGIGPRALLSLQLQLHGQSFA